MIVATIDFPDERTGADHLHGLFKDEKEATWWAGWVSVQLGGIDLRPRFEHHDERWTCPVCRWATRGGRRPKTA